MLFTKTRSDPPREVDDAERVPNNIKGTRGANDVRSFKAPSETLGAYDIVLRRRRLLPADARAG